MTAKILRGDCVAVMNTMPEKSVDLVFGSPPYMDARTYQDDTLPKGSVISRDCLEWVEWMLEVTATAARVSSGPVFWVAAGVTRDRNYWPGCEGLMWEWWKRGGDCHLYRPCAWVKTDNNDGGTGIPGSGGDDYLRADWEYVMCFKRPGKLAWADNIAMGSAPVCEEVGGEMSNRTVEGGRVNKIGPNRRGNGKYKKSERTRMMDAPAGHGENGNLGDNARRPLPKIANPGNVVRARVGGGHMGSRLCHEGEAPFPENLAEFFVLSFCPPGGTVLDPFSGSGTTATVAVRHGRKAIGIDLRQSQVDLANRRLDLETPLSLLVE